MSLHHQSDRDILSRQNERETLFDVLLHGIIGVDYVLRTRETSAAPSESSTRFVIEREERTAGGLMWRVAQILQAAQGRVALLGNVLGDDSNGRLVARQNQKAQFLYGAASQNLTSFETPYRVVLQTCGEKPAFLTRYQAAQEDDFARRKSLDEIAQYPRAQKICVSDELPLTALHLARWAKTQRIPIVLACTGLLPFNDDAHSAVKELRELATSVFDCERDTQADWARANNDPAQTWNDARAVQLERMMHFA